MTDINKLWEHACSGNIEELKKYYDNGGSINNRYIKFGEGHSLIMGAFRNNQFDTVEYLMSEGEELSPKEFKEIQTEMRKMEIMHKLVESQEQKHEEVLFDMPTM